MNIIFDIEADGLLDEVKKIHCFSYRTLDNQKIRTIYKYKDMRKLLKKCKILVGHNIVQYDIPVLERILGIEIKARLFDTLALSWYLNHSRILHGLESYGEDYGKPKPEIDDWHNLSREEYTHRCETDVWINAMVWHQLKAKLMELYENPTEAGRLIDYLTFKMDCLREQSRSGWRLDVERAKKNSAILTQLKEEKITELTGLMPKVPIIVKKTRPAKPFKKCGNYSSHGANWFALLDKKGLPEDYDGEVDVLVGYEEPKPTSHQQIKDWLFSLGWKPQNFKFTTLKDGTENKVPQVRIEGDEGKELCPSVLKLADKEPGIKVLEDLTVITHRLDIFNNFLKFEQDGYLKAEASGLTNTLRFKHKNPLVNLPGVGKPWGKEIRGCLIAPEGYVQCGSDMVSLESSTKRHFMYPYDPEYVKEMSDPNFDEHLDLAKQAGEVTQEDILDYIQGVAPHIKPIRTKFKPVNYGLNWPM